jgi:dTDP-4-amino-4,6-dideoxygalactose transaminase/acetyltransferase-like isoleucine patch superfamily enzyme
MGSVYDVEDVEEASRAVVRQNVTIAPTAIVHPNVKLGENVIIEDFCIIGYPPKGSAPGDLETVIGANTHIRTHAVIYAGTTLGEKCHVGHMAFIRENTIIGNHCSIGVSVLIEHHCRIGDRVRIQGQAGISEHTIIEEDAWIGPRVLTANVYHPTCDRAKDCLSGPIIRKGAIVGGSVSIVPDIEIGERAFIGLGSVVMKSVPAEAIFSAAPARKIGDVNKVPCRYDMIAEASPFIQTRDVGMNIPLVDLGAQHQSLKQEIRLAIDAVMLNTRFINGKEVSEFERSFAEFCSAPYAVGLSSGTDALQLALIALGIGAGDEVITSPHTFIATVEAILHVGARPIFVDIDPHTFLLDTTQIESKITAKTKAIIAVHIHGQCAPMDLITAIAVKHSLFVIEDAAQAQGSMFNGHPVGYYSDVACFSFFPGKNLGAYGDAGGIVTQNKAIADKIKKLSDHGRIGKYESDVVGFNCRLDTMHAAILNVKLLCLDRWNQTRRELAALYLQGLAGLPITFQYIDPKAVTIYHHFIIALDNRDALQSFLKERGVATGVHYPIPMHRQPALKFLDLNDDDYPVTNRVASRILSLPIYPELEPKKVMYIVEQIKAFFAAQHS